MAMKNGIRVYITPRHVTMFFSAFCMLGACGYFAWILFPVFQAPRLALEEPKDITTLATTPEEELRGSVGDGARLTVNREEVYLDADGNFAQPLFLASGLNVIEFMAKGRFGRETRLTRYIILKNLKR